MVPTPREDAFREQPVSAPPDAFSFIFVGLWSYWFYLRSAVAARFLPLALLALSAVELVAPAFHIVGVHHRLTTAIVLFLVASILTYHHGRLRARIARHNAILSSMTLLLEEESTRGPEDDKEELKQMAICRILDALVFAVEYTKTEGVMNASVVIRDRPESHFRIAYQDSEQHFDTEIVLDPRASVAGRLAQERTPDGRPLIYVPMTRYLHGVRIAGEDRTFYGPAGIVSKRERYRTTRIVPSAFQTLSGFASQSDIKCLLCIQIPTGGVREDGSQPFAVLCLSSRQSDCMGFIEFSAIRVAAALISFMLRGH